MASTPVAQHDKIKPSSNGLNNLFSRLETMRAAHLTASTNAGSSTANIGSAFTTNVAVTGNKAERANVQQLKNDIDYIAASGSFTANKGSTVTNVTVPAVGDLITATNFNAWDTVVTNMENVCAHYSRYGTRYSSEYSGRYDSFYSGFYSGHYDGFYSSFYSSYYGSKYGGYYSSFYSGQYEGYYHSRYSRGGCLAAGTKILMADKTLKNIEEIKINELVTVFNEKTGKFEEKAVKKTSEHHGKFNMIKITLSDNSKIVLTAGHPILGVYGWESYNTEESLSVHNVYAKKIKIGDEIIGLQNSLKIVNIEELNDSKDYDIYNLEIDDIHNFIAMTSQDNGVITHNAKKANDFRIKDFITTRS